MNAPTKNECLFPHLVINSVSPIFWILVYLTGKKLDLGEVLKWFSLITREVKYLVHVYKTFVVSFLEVPFCKCWSSF